MTNHLSYFEIRCTDYNRSLEFYNSVFKWDINASPDGPNYGIINLGKGIEGGLGQNEGNKPPFTILYFSVEDINETLAAVEKAGGRIRTPKTLITEEHGYFAHFEDPDGNLIGLSGSK